MTQWSRTSLLLLIAAAATIRLFLQINAMPPYAGLDEIYHVARLAFVAREGRNPGIGEPSVPPYLTRSIAGDASALPKVLTANDLAPYVGPNYEAQQPSLYYSIAAPLVHVLSARTPLAELREWRLFSLVFAVITILAIALIAERFFGTFAMLASALLLSMPTWITLVARASNDALACALLACACLVTFSNPRTWRGWTLEGVLWALAMAVKLYAWPPAVMLPFVWSAAALPPLSNAPEARSTRFQSGSRAAALQRAAIVTSLGALAVAFTAFDLASRTNNPLGMFAFDRVAPTSPGSLADIQFVEMLKITIASFAWTSGHHWNALRPLAIALYLGPVMAIIAFFVFKHRREGRYVLAVAAVAAAGFAFAQIVSAGAYIRRALAVGETMPAGGKEGWYWFALAPVFIGVIALALKRAPRLVVAALVIWIVGWDVLITEGALFQDYAGLTSPANGDALFRWGPRRLPSLSVLRVIELALLAAATFAATRLRAAAPIPADTSR